MARRASKADRRQALIALFDTAEIEIENARIAIVRARSSYEHMRNSFDLELQLGLHDKDDE